MTEIRAPNRLFTDEEVREIRRDCRIGKRRNYDKVAKKWGCAETTVAAINNGKRYAWIPDVELEIEE